MSIKVCCVEMARAVGDGLLEIGMHEASCKLCIAKKAMTNDGGHLDVWTDSEVEVKFCPFCGQRIEYGETEK